MRDGSAQLFLSDLFVSHRLHNFRARDKHVRTVFDHEDEVGHGWRVNGAARAWAHDQRDLRNDPRSQHITLKDIGIAAQRGNAFLDSCSARVVNADHRGSNLHRMIHDLADLLGVGLRQRAAEHGEVLAEDEYHASIDRAVAGYDAVAGDALSFHPKVAAAMFYEHVPFFKRAWIEQQFDALARREFALLVLRVDPSLATTHFGGGTLFFQLSDDVLHVRSRSVRGRVHFSGASAQAHSLRSSCRICC